MREIKFRAWNTTAKRMIYDIQQEPADSTQYSFSNYLEDKNNNVVMQFTGRNDHTGKDIYEDDLVRTTNIPHPDYEYDNFDEHYEGVVTYDTSDAAYTIVQAGKDYAPMLSNIYIDTIEVVGNIHEARKGQ